MRRRKDSFVRCEGKKEKGTKKGHQPEAKPNRTQPNEVANIPRFFPPLAKITPYRDTLT
jgi:hypothetical protein